ncbi:MAG: hypothetical protein LUD16_13300 [Lachnospiraceae bacterium]|nr:hypothetical protein [Lachnospiraceae bacterium]
MTDDIWNHTNDWTDYYSCFATVSGEDSVKSAESETAATTTDHSGISFTVRYCKAASVINSTEYRGMQGLPIKKTLTNGNATAFISMNKNGDFAYIKNIWQNS